MPELDPKYRGTKTYLLTAGFYDSAQGRTYAPGEKITVTDTVPGKTWQLVTGADAEGAVELPPPVAPKGAAKAGWTAPADPPLFEPEKPKTKHGKDY